MYFILDLEKMEVGHSVPKVIKDEEIVETMSKHFNMSPQELWDDIKKEKYDYCMATYLILLEKKRNNEDVILQNISGSRKVRT